METTLTNAPANNLESVVRHHTSGLGQAGVSVALLAGGDLRSVALGVANPVLSEPMTADTLVQIGSTSKLHNAVLVMQLVERGLLDLDRPVIEVLRRFRLDDARAAESLTLRHCLAMTSGMGGGPFPGDFGSDADCLDRYVQALGDVPHLFPPGAGFGYSNAGSVVAARAAEVVTGERWDDLLRSELLEPAGMRHTETIAERLMFHRVAVGTGADGQVIRPFYWTRSIGPGGSTCLATADDLVRLAELFLSQGDLDGTTVVSGETLTLMTQPVVAVPTAFPAEHWCLGPNLTKAGEHSILGHHGGNAAGTSLLWWVPELRVAIACVTNAPFAFGPITRCARAILSSLGVDLPVARTPVPAAGISQPIAGVYQNAFMRFEVTEHADGPLLRITQPGPPGSQEIVTRLKPIGPDVFVPSQPLLPGFDAPVPIAFCDYAGEAILLNGNGPAKRIS